MQTSKVCSHGCKDLSYHARQAMICSMCTYTICKECYVEMRTQKVAPSTAAQSTTPATSSECLQPLTAVVDDADTRCHICRSGSLQLDVAPVFEWMCEGAAGASWRCSGGSAVFQGQALAAYRHIRDSRQKRMACDVPPSCMNYRIIARDGYLARDHTEEAATSRRCYAHPSRHYCCRELDAFEYKLHNPGAAQTLVWCGVCRSCRSCRDGLDAIPTAVPIANFVCPPSLPGVQDVAFCFTVPSGAYARGVHELVLYPETTLTCSQQTAEAGQPRSPHLASILRVSILHNHHMGSLLEGQAANSDSNSDSSKKNNAVHQLEAASSTDRSTGTVSSGRTGVAANADLCFAVDNLLQGRNVAVWGLGSKYDFLSEVVHCFALAEAAVYFLDGFRPKQQAAAGAQAGVPTAEGIRRIEQHIINDEYAHNVKQEELTGRAVRSCDAPTPTASDDDSDGEGDHPVCDRDRVDSTSRAPNEVGVTEPSPVPMCPQSSTTSDGALFSELSIFQVVPEAGVGRFVLPNVKFSNVRQFLSVHKKRKRHVREWCATHASSCAVEPLMQILVVHNIDLLDAAAIRRLAAISSRHTSTLRLLCSFDDPHYLVAPGNTFSAILSSFGFVGLTRHTTLPKVLETSFYLQEPSRVVKHGGGVGSSTLPMADTVRRVLISLPMGFRSVLQLCIDYQREEGEDQALSVAQLQDYIESRQVVLSAGRMRAVLAEIAYNRLGVYDASTQTLKLHQCGLLEKCLSELAA